MPDRIGRRRRRDWPWLVPATAAASEWPLSGYWPMYEGRGQVVHDISGMGNHGRLGSSVSTDGRDADWTTGLYGIGKALRFDGNDYIAIPDNPSLGGRHRHPVQRHHQVRAAL